MKAERDTASFEYEPAPRPWRDPPFQVLDTGEAEVLVPVTFASAPSVVGIEVQATVSSSHATGAGLKLKIAGTGIGGSAKITVTRTQKVTAAAGELVGLAIALPVLWERRADLDNLDRSWSHIEVRATGHEEVPIVSFTDPALVRGGHAFATVPHDLRVGGTKPLETSDERTVEGGATFSVGFTNAAIGIEASLEATIEASSTISLTATLPMGYRYAVGWWEAPGGVAVTEG